MSVATFTSTLSLFLSIVGTGINEQSIPIPPLQNPASPAVRLPWTFNSGDNIIPPPSSPQNPGAVCIIIFQTPPGNVTFKGAAGDTGYLMTGGPLAALGQFFFVIPVGNGTAASMGNPGAFIINVSTQTNGTIYFI